MGQHHVRTNDMYYHESTFAPLFYINGEAFRWQDEDGHYWDSELPNHNSVNNPAQGYQEKTEQLVRSTRNANGQVIATVINRRLNKFDSLRWPYLSRKSVQWLRNQIAKFDCTLSYWDIDTGKVITRQFYWGDFEATPCEWEAVEVPAGSGIYYKIPLWYKDVKCNLIDKGY